MAGAKKTPKSDSTVGDHAPGMDMIDDVLDAVEAHVADLKAQGGPGLVNEMLVIARKAAPLVEAQRKMRKLEQNEARELTPALIVSWAKQQTPEARARLVQDVTAIDAPRRSVLG